MTQTSSPNTLLCAISFIDDDISQPRYSLFNYPSKPLPGIDFEPFFHVTNGHEVSFQLQIVNPNITFVVKDGKINFLWIDVNNGQARIIDPNHPPKGFAGYEVSADHKTVAIRWSALADTGWSIESFRLPIRSKLSAGGPPRYVDPTIINKPLEGGLLP